MLVTICLLSQDELIQRYIMQANVWDPTKKKLPKRFNAQIPGWKFKAETGIPRRRIMYVSICVVFMSSGQTIQTPDKKNFYPSNMVPSTCVLGWSGSRSLLYVFTYVSISKCWVCS